MSNFYKELYEDQAKRAAKMAQMIGFLQGTVDYAIISNDDPKVVERLKESLEELEVRWTKMQNGEE